MLQRKIQKELVDKLLGEDRNLTEAEKKAKAAARLQSAKKFKLNDPRLCKFFLCGFCPYMALQYTKNEIGTCSKLHDAAAQSLFQSLPMLDRKRLGYEQEFAKFLKGILDDMDKKRLERFAQQVAQLEAERAVTRQRTHQMTVEEITARMAEIDTELPPLLKSVETFGEEGEVAKADEAMAKADKLRKEREDLLVQIKEASNARQMTTCDVCGALLVVGDTEQRIQSHKEGKQHLAFCQIREWLAAYDERNKAAAATAASTTAASTTLPSKPESYTPNKPQPSSSRSGESSSRYRRSRSRSHSRDRDRRRRRSSSSSSSGSSSGSSSSGSSSSSSSSSRSRSRSPRSRDGHRSSHSRYSSRYSDHGSHRGSRYH